MFKRRIVIRDLVLSGGDSNAKRHRPSDTGDGEGVEAGDGAETSETWDALRRMLAQFPSDSFQPALPRIALKHQLHSLCQRRSRIDTDLHRLRESGRVRQFKIGGELDERFALLLAEEFEQFARARRGRVSDVVLNRYLTLVLRDTTDLSLAPGPNLPFSDAEITDLVQAGFLTVRDSGCYWVACPDMGRFVGVYRKMRARIMRTLRRTKYKEMLHSDLDARLPQSSPPLDYMMHDLVGDGTLRSVVTTSGVLYRLP